MTAPTLQHRLDSGLTGRYTIARELAEEAWQPCAWVIA
jgi:hypothetical protein